MNQVAVRSWWRRVAELMEPFLWLTALGVGGYYEEVKVEATMLPLSVGQRLLALGIRSGGWTGIYRSDPR